MTNIDGAGIGKLWVGGAKSDKGDKVTIEEAAKLLKVPVAEFIKLVSSKNLTISEKIIDEDDNSTISGDDTFNNLEDLAGIINDKIAANGNQAVYDNNGALIGTFGSYGYAEIAATDVSNIVANATMTGATISWDQVVGAGSYKVTVSASGNDDQIINAGFEVIDGSSGTTYVLKDILAPGAFYCVKITALDTNNNEIAEGVKEFRTSAPVVTESKEPLKKASITVTDLPDGAKVWYQKKEKDTDFTSVEASNGSATITGKNTGKYFLEIPGSSANQSLFYYMNSDGAYTKAEQITGDDGSTVIKTAQQVAQDESVKSLKVLSADNNIRVEDVTVEDAKTYFAGVGLDGVTVSFQDSEMVLTYGDKTATLADGFTYEDLQEAAKDLGLEDKFICTKQYFKLVANGTKLEGDDQKISFSEITEAMRNLDKYMTLTHVTNKTTAAKSFAVAKYFTELTPSEAANIEKTKNESYGRWSGIQDKTDYYKAAHKALSDVDWSSTSTNLTELTALLDALAQKMLPGKTFADLTTDDQFKQIFGMLAFMGWARDNMEKEQVYALYGLDKDSNVLDIALDDKVEGEGKEYWEKKLGGKKAEATANNNDKTTIKNIVASGSTGTVNVSWGEFAGASMYQLSILDADKKIVKSSDVVLPPNLSAELTDLTLTVAQEYTIKVIAANDKGLVAIGETKFIPSEPGNLETAKSVVKKVMLNRASSENYQKVYDCVDKLNDDTGDNEFEQFQTWVNSSDGPAKKSTLHEILTKEKIYLKSAKTVVLTALKKKIKEYKV